MRKLEAIATFLSQSATWEKKKISIRCVTWKKGQGLTCVRISYVHGADAMHLSPHR
jgi:hypothetical protein